MSSEKVAEIPKKGRELLLSLPQKCRLLAIYGSYREAENKYFSFYSVTDRDGLERSDKFMSKLFYLTRGCS